MKAIMCKKYGSPSNLVLVDVPKPSPKDDELLIEVHAASINSYDHRIMRGSPFLVRFREGLVKPRNKIMGADISGIVVGAGKNANAFKVGDEVYTCLADSSGDAGYAEYACAKESVVAKKPSGMTFEQAAAIPMAAVTALQGLRDVGKIKAGHQVLVNGASGGVGTFAVQLAKAFGAEVTGVCSGKNAQMVQSLGADFLIDYAKEDFTESEKQYDIILDIAANHSPKEIRRTLKTNGVCAVVGFSSIGHMLSNALFGSQTTKRDGKKIVLVMADNTKSQDLDVISGLFEAEKLKPVIDGVYPLGETEKAFRYYENEHAKGKIVISLVEHCNAVPKTVK